jgi:protein N-lysine methyltransferase METTL21D
MHASFACDPLLAPTLISGHLLPRRLALASMGWDVLATDVPAVLPLLQRNVVRNCANLPPASGRVSVRELDWFAPPEKWNWDHPSAVSSIRTEGSPERSDPEHESLKPPFDLIFTADTLYEPSLTAPLLRTLYHLALLSGPSYSARPLTILVCLERRDPALIDAALLAAKEDWGFVLTKVPQRKLAKALERGGINWSKDKDDWEGVEIWKMALPRTRGSADGLAASS